MAAPFFLEIWERIATFLPLKDAISLSETSRLTNEATRLRIWKVPVLKRWISLENLSTISHLPIRELRTSVLSISYDHLSPLKQIVGRWKLIAEQFNLETLHIDYLNSSKHGTLQAHLVNTLPVQVVIHTSISSIACIGYDDSHSDSDHRFKDQHFSKFFDLLAGMDKLKGLVIDHDTHQGNRKWTLDEFKKLMVFPIRDVEMSSLAMNKKNREKFISLIYKICKMKVL